MSGDALAVEGVVVAEARGDLFTVDVELGRAKKRVLAKRSGRLVKAHIRLLPGDRVQLELSPYDLTRGRITWRGRDQRSA
jgi:translation initiation factor IF-1